MGTVEEQGGKSLNRTFYGIETCTFVSPCPSASVLIVPFMELKLVEIVGIVCQLICLNRTFYGIETGHVIFLLREIPSLNRTFYGIETSEMELPYGQLGCLNRTIKTLYRG